MIDLNLNPSKKELRTFGLCALGFLCLAGWIVGRRTDSITNGAAIAAIGLVLAVLGQLGARANWYRLARERIYDDPPTTDLGRAEAEFFSLGSAPRR